MTRPLRITVLGIAAVGLAAVTLTLHPRAALPAIAFCGLLHVARCTRLAAVVLLVLMIGTLAGVRVDAAPPAPAGVER